ncbi:DUF2586 family protein [Hymenobacter sp. ASUV-10]|uniref:DUF2586 family protein n=1 Tax=Hymenobacter aranciens TaxID=3063996 RepID=A0ABT9BK47_9BACT|nr:DUF2586 family protein [Hymenobacter sp. ASUV-10]MDO7877377.1 DUF2586 family protein [Hymenobacter sp. ASUV-10]
MALPDITITKAAGGLGRQQPTDDGISAFITQGVAISGKLTLGTVYELRSIQAAEAIGITATATNFTRTYRHLSEFFRLSPGAVLLFMAVARTATMADICDHTLGGGAKALLSNANGRVKQLAVCLNPASGYTPVTTGGLDADVLTTVAKAQALAAEEFDQHRPVAVLLAGHSLLADLTTAPNLRALSSEYVAVVAGTDHTLLPNEPAIGTALGAISAARVNESIAWVQKFNLTGDGSFVNAGLSNGKALSELLPGDLGALSDKGFIVVRQHAGLDGFYFSDTPTCTVVSSDYAQLENVRTTNKAARVCRTALLPALNGPLPVNADGTLQAQVIGELQGKAKTALNAALLESGEASALGVYIDPAQNVISDSKLAVKVRIVPTGVARQITVDLGLSTKLS